MSAGIAALLARCASIACALVAPSLAHAVQEAETAAPEVSLRYVTDIVAVVDGGVRRDAKWLGRFDVSVSSGDDFLGIPEARGYADLMILHGGGLSERLVGDAQVVSNIDAPSAARPFEAWIEAPLGTAMRGKIGLIDLNSEFDLQPVGATFLNSSFGIAPDYSQSGDNGPSIFPVTSLGAIVAVERSRWSVKAAVFDARPGDPARPRRFLPTRPGRGGALLAVEGAARVGARGDVQVGSWFYTDRFDRLDGTGRGRSWGAYAQYEHRLVGGEDDGDALKGWVRAGHAAPMVNEIGLYVGGGLRWGDDDRHLGIGIGHARLGDPALRVDPGRRAETVVEVTAFRRVAPWLAVQPDVQYVRNPGWRGTPDAVVLGMRLHVASVFPIGKD